jgi:hypothetical protein
MTHRLRLAAAALALAVAAAAPPPPKLTSAPQAPPAARPTDNGLFVTLKEVINRGADLYNDGDPAACYRLYEGSLMTIRPALDRYPQLQSDIARGLRAAEKDPVVWRRAFTLRDVLDKVRAEVNPARNRDAPKGTEESKPAEKLKTPKKSDPDKDAG